MVLALPRPYQGATMELGTLQSLNAGVTGFPVHSNRASEMRRDELMAFSPRQSIMKMRNWSFKRKVALQTLIPSCSLDAIEAMKTIPWMDFKDGENKVGTKNKVVFVLGATATGKSQLAIDLALHFRGEVINSDKIQVHEGLDIITNKVPEEERQGVPHHLLGILDPDADFSMEDFCEQALNAMHHIVRKGGLPIVAGGSNRYIQALVEGSPFQADFDACFLWMDIDVPVLHDYIARRVDRMVADGFIEEVQAIYAPGKDYSRGIWKAIGVPELEPYFNFEEEKMAKDETSKKALLENAIELVKKNTCRLANVQIAKIHRLQNEHGWKLHRIDATSVLRKKGKEGTKCMDTWKRVALEPSLSIVADFLEQ